jgi:hypothetical protein
VEAAATGASLVTTHRILIRHGLQFSGVRFGGRCSPDQVLQEQPIRKEKKATDRRRTGDAMRNGGLGWTSGSNDPTAGSSTSMYCCDRRALDRGLTDDAMRNGGLVWTSGSKAGSSTSMY